MKADVKAKITFGVWGFIIGAVIAMIIGFKWGGWTTSGTTQQITAEAVLASQAAICVAQFMKDPDQKNQLDKFQKLESYDRPKFIAEGGWDKMPGQKEASDSVSKACAEGLEAFIKK